MNVHMLAFVLPCIFKDACTANKLGMYRGRVPLGGKGSFFLTRKIQVKSPRAKGSDRFAGDYLVRSEVACTQNRSCHPEHLCGAPYWSPPRQPVGLGWQRACVTRESVLLAVPWVRVTRPLTKGSRVSYGHPGTWAGPPCELPRGWNLRPSAVPDLCAPTLWHLTVSFPKVELNHTNILFTSLKTLSVQLRTPNTHTHAPQEICAHPDTGRLYLSGTNRVVRVLVCDRLCACGPGLLWNSYIPFESFNIQCLGHTT